MSSEYQKLIQEHDKTISMLRGEWMRSAANDKPKWMDRINETLDERLRLMKLRDQQEESA